MPFITKQDFTSHIYEEAINTISRADEAKLTEAINAAMAEAASYLTRYDTDAIFATTLAADKVKYANLIFWIKDIAKWHFIAVCNASVSLELAEVRYKNAIAELMKIMQGKLQPVGWPLPVDEASQSNIIYSGSAPKFNHYY